MVENDDDDDDDDDDDVMARRATITSYLKSTASTRVRALVVRVERQQANRRRQEEVGGEEEVGVPSSIHRSDLMSEISAQSSGQQLDWVLAQLTPVRVSACVHCKHWRQTGNTTSF